MERAVGGQLPVIQQEDERVESWCRREESVGGAGERRYLGGDKALSGSENDYPTLQCGNEASSHGTRTLNTSLPRLPDSGNIVLLKSVRHRRLLSIMSFQATRRIPGLERRPRKAIVSICVSRDDDTVSVSSRSDSYVA